MANPWIDLSAYRMTLVLGVMDPPVEGLPQRTLAIAGDAEANAEALGGLGFVRHPLFNRWIHPGPARPPGVAAIAAAFPQARIIPDVNLRDHAQRLTVARAPAPVSPAEPVQASLPVLSALPVAPSVAVIAPAAAPAAAALADQVEVAAGETLVRTGGADVVSTGEQLELVAPIAAPAPAARVPVRAEEMRLETMMEQSHNLGLNRQGQQVLSGPRGRFLLDNNRAQLEGANKALPPSLFLRATDPEQLALAAEGFVEELASGAVLRFADLRRFTEAAFEADIKTAADLGPQDHAQVFDQRLVDSSAAIEAAMSRWLIRKGGRTLADLWHASQRLHESAAYVGDLTRHMADAPDAHPPLPRPVALAIQRALGTESELKGKKVVFSGGGTAFAHMPRGADLKVYVSGANDTVAARTTLAAARFAPASLAADPAVYDGADVVVANLRPGLLDRPRTFAGGLTVSRSDVAEALDALERRNPMGRSVLVLRGGGNPEAREELERAREWIGARYAIEGTIDIAGAMHTGRPEADPLRMMVVSRLRPAVLDAAPEPAMRLREINSFANLWTWTAQLVSARVKIDEFYAEEEARALQEMAGAADPDLLENGFQAPYESMSAVGQASTMVPRMLEGATRDALGRVARKHGDVDQWVANEIGMTKAQLEERFSPEQVDAAALTFDAEERERAFLNCDMTGIGKGRYIAAVMRRAALQGKNVLFITEREINISDIWRDIRHVGADQDFSPLILNDGAEAIDEQTGDVVLSAPKRDYTMGVMNSREWPAEHNLVIATYSQFNKPGEPPQPRRRRRVPVDPQAALPAPAAQPALAGPDHDEAGAAMALADPAQAEAAAQAAREAAAAQALAEAAAQVSPKSAWLRNAVDGNTVVILDECHNAASGSSNASVNIAAALRRAGAVVFSSATFAKNAKTMDIYAPLFPPDFDTANLTEIMRKGGETMQETLSAMLVKDGVMIRREHDLSKCEFRVVNDDVYADRNRAYMDALAPVLAEMAYLAGDLDKKVNAQNEQVEQNLRRRFRGDDARVRKQMKSLQTNRIGFGSPLYNLSRLFVCSLLVDKTADECITALRSGKKPVVLVENTVQAIMEELLQGEAEGAVAPDFKDLVRRVLGQLTRVSRQKNGNRVVEDMAEPNDAADLGADAAEAIVTAMRPLIGEDLLRADEEPAEVVDYRAQLRMAMLQVSEAMLHEPGANDEAIAQGLEAVRAVIDGLPEDVAEAAPAIRRLDALLPDTPARAVRRIHRLIDALPDLPVSSIDAVRDKVETRGQQLFAAGEIERPWSMGEITGRSLQFRDGQISRRAPVRKVDVKNDFNSGVIDGVIINTAGATGIDLHAGRRFLDQSQRVLIEQQPPADITKQIQAYGRVNRFDQVIGPQIISLMAGLPMELRLVAMRNQKLRRLSANITSNREHSALIAGIPDLMNPVGDMVCSRYAEARPDLMRLLGFDVERNLKVEERNKENAGDGMVEDQRDSQRSANEFLARLAMLSVGRQTQVLEELEAEYVATIQELDARGENPLKSKTIDGIVHMRERGVFDGAEVDNPTSEFHRPVYLQKVVIERAIEPLRGADVASEVERGMVAADTDGVEDCANSLERSKDRVLSTYVPMEISVADALAAGNFRLLNVMNERMDRLIGSLRDLKPGMGVKMSLDGVVEDTIVTRVVPPTRRYMHLASAYDVRMAAPGWAKPLSFSLQSLLNDPNYEINQGLHGDDADAILAGFDQAIEGARLESRTIMTGNDWAAMNIAIQHKLGSMTSWTDVQGVRYRGVLISKKVEQSQDRLDCLPIAMRSVDMAVAALSSGTMDVFGNSELHPGGIHIRRKKGDAKFYEISMPPENSRKYGAIYEHPPIGLMVHRLNVAEPDADGFQRSPRLRVPAADLHTVLGHLMDGGCRLFSSSRHRKWATDWMAEHYAQHNPDAAADHAPRVAA
jgi:hypothetical protein